MSQKEPEATGDGTWHPGMPDRRKRPTPPFSRYWLRGHRRGDHQGKAGRDIYVDRYQPLEWLLVAGVLAMSILDMVLTLDVVDKGGGEVNPVMRAALEGGPFWFAGVKIVVTVLCLTFALAHIRFRRAKVLLLGVFCAYGLLMAYHVYIQIRLG